MAHSVVHKNKTGEGNRSGAEGGRSTVSMRLGQARQHGGTGTGAEDALGHGESSCGDKKPREPRSHGCGAPASQRPSAVAPDPCGESLAGRFACRLLLGRSLHCRLPLRATLVPVYVFYYGQQFCCFLSPLHALYRWSGAIPCCHAASGAVASASLATGTWHLQNGGIACQDR